MLSFGKRCLLASSLVFCALGTLPAKDTEVGMITIKNSSTLRDPQYGWTVNLEKLAGNTANCGLQVQKVLADGVVEAAEIKYHGSNKGASLLKLDPGTSYKVRFYSNNDKTIKATLSLRDRNNNGPQFEFESSKPSSFATTQLPDYISTRVKIGEDLMEMNLPPYNDPNVTLSTDGRTIEIKTNNYPLKKVP